LHGNTVRSIRDDPSKPQIAIWAPTGPIQNTTTEFFWTFFIREKPSPSSSIYVGLSDLTTIEGSSRLGLLGLFYGADLYEAENFINDNLEEDFGKLEVGNVILMHVKNGKGKMTVYFGSNFNPEYEHYEFPIRYFNGLYPVVRIHGRGVVEVNEKTRDFINGRNETAEIKKEI